ncbi:MAG: histidine kinase [Chitinophagaceae bacterium]|nr:histidine kinase [Chitinophagaceae bacterium]
MHGYLVLPAGLPPLYQMQLGKFWKKKIIWGISSAELGIWFLYNFFWGSLFFMVLLIAYDITNPARQATVVGFDILVKMLLTIPSWFLVFRVWPNKPLSFLIPYHLLYMSFFGLAWVFIFGYGIRTMEYKPAPFIFHEMMVDFYISVVFYSLEFAIFHAYHYLQRTKRQMKREQELKDLAYQSEIKALKAQIEPHFLFNTLNSISASVPPSLEKTRILIAQLADTFRYALKVSERQMVSLEEELSFVRTWLALENHRFGDRLTVQYFIEPVVLSTQVPPMILQPLIENALNHGISPLVKGGSVSITCQQTDQFVYITVSDTGVGYEGNIDELLQKGIGLKSTAERIDRLFNEKLEIKRNPQGLRVMFRIPAL